MLRILSEPYRVFSSSSLPLETQDQAIDARRTWLAILSGLTRVSASACTPEGLYLELEETPAGRPLPEKCAALIERLLLGDSSKRIAIERNCSPSTVTLRATGALTQMGISCAPGAVPAGLLWLANAARDRFSGSLQAKLRPVQGKRQHSLLVIRRPDVQLIEELSPAERAVADMLVEARNHRQMAKLRGSSERTVANQIASIYRKLAVSGRIPLFIRLAQRDCGVGRMQ
jgi:DNA-binding NarL/FixJ family response regulator